MMYRNLLDMLQERERQFPDKRAFVYLQNGENESENATYSELYKSSVKVAAYLQYLELKGERALILLPSGIEYIVAFLGCLQAGVIPIPAYPPTKSRNNDRLLSIYENAEPGLIILPSRAMTAKLPAAMRDAPIILIEEMLENQFPYDSMVETIEPDDIAFLQYTSGSTSTPKGVMVTHRNLLHNFNLMATQFGHSVHTRIVTWLPFYHDMGLIGNILQNIYNGGMCYIMAPLDFIQKPVRWLNAISKYSATYSGGPDFSYQLCSRNITEEEKSSLRLDCWSSAYCGSEPVHAETLRMFYESFRDYGLRKESLLPGYGLAEFTLCATVSRAQTGPVVQAVDEEALRRNEIVPVSEQADGGVRLVSSGVISDFLNVEIVNPITREPCQTNQIGEIWLRGESVAKGYWNDPYKSQEVFQAAKAQGREGDFYLRTGDLGFICNGELFVTGRWKDLIIIRGQNYYPQDIEWIAASSHEDLHETNAAAFSIERQGSEKLVVVCEMKRELRHKSKARQLDLTAMLEEVARMIRTRILDELQIEAYDIRIVPPLGIPKTSSSKVQRGKCKAMYLNGTLPQWGEDVERAIEARL
ncbi:fatty acyl-AMP ligase [Paenibacillus sp. M1]|uniref:Fatty acyl-AMP ligase n=1 Tax=Paenibacillus haidiansis TaxID=1574488 RepID=A0ABU7VPK1_9BACL